MSNEKENEYFTLDDGDKLNECNVSYGAYQENIIYKIVYSPKIGINEIREHLNWVKRYISFDDEDVKFRILGEKFIKINSNKCKIIYKNKKYKLKEFFKEIDDNYEDKDTIKLKLFGADDIIDMNRMFCKCYHLISISEYSIEIIIKIIVIQFVIILKIIIIQIFQVKTSQFHLIISKILIYLKYKGYIRLYQIVMMLQILILIDIIQNHLQNQKILKI